MAKRRMLSQEIINDDRFIDMPLSTQALYMHLNVNADDEGFLNTAKRIQRIIGASEDDMKLLIAKGYVIPFESGVIVITHWKQHNYIQSDRFHATTFAEERARLKINDKTKTYEPQSVEIPTMCPECIQDGYKMDTEVRLDKVSLDKDRLGKDRLDKSSCSYTRVWDELTEEEIEAIEYEWHDGYELIDTVAREVKQKRRIIDKDKVFAYIVGYARNQNWMTEREHKEMEKFKEE